MPLNRSLTNIWNNVTAWTLAQIPTQLHHWPTKKKTTQSVSYIFSVFCLSKGFSFYPQKPLARDSVNCFWPRRLYQPTNEPTVLVTHKDTLLPFTKPHWLHDSIWYLSLCPLLFCVGDPAFCHTHIRVAQICLIYQATQIMLHNCTVTVNICP